MNSCLLLMCGGTVPRRPATYGLNTTKVPSPISVGEGPRPPVSYGFVPTPPHLECPFFRERKGHKEILQGLCPRSLPTARQKVRRRERTAVFRLLQYRTATPIQRYITNKRKSCRKFAITVSLSTLLSFFSGQASPEQVLSRCSPTPVGENCVLPRRTF